MNLKWSVFGFGRTSRPHTHTHTHTHTVAQIRISYIFLGQINARKRCVSCRIISKLAAVTFEWKKLVRKNAVIRYQGAGQKYILKRKKTLSAGGTWAISDSVTKRANYAYRWSLVPSRLVWHLCAFHCPNQHGPHVRKWGSSQTAVQLSKSTYRIYGLLFLFCA